MIPDLGKYATEIGLAYVISLALLAGLIWHSLRVGRRIRTRLQNAEKATRK
jgi:heme exporter protein D